MSNMVVRTNIFSLNAHRNLKNVGLEQVRSSRRLSSGYRINSAADDAAGLAISETMRAQIRGLDQASRNSQDAQALVMTTEGGLQEITNMIQRARELTVQAANDTNVDLNRNQIAYEIGHLAMEIAQMQTRVEFNTRQTLNMTEESQAQGRLHFQIGANSNQSLFHDFSNISDAITDAVHVTTVLAGALGMVIDTSVFETLDSHMRIGPPPRPVGDFPGRVWGTSWTEMMNFLPTVDRDQIAQMAAAASNEASEFSTRMNTLSELAGNVADALRNSVNGATNLGAIHAASGGVSIFASNARMVASAAVAHATAAFGGISQLAGFSALSAIIGGTPAGMASVLRVYHALSNGGFGADSIAAVNAYNANTINNAINQLNWMINNPDMSASESALLVAARDAMINSRTTGVEAANINNAVNSWATAGTVTQAELASAQAAGVARDVTNAAATAEAADAAAARHARQTMDAAGATALNTNPALAIIGGTSEHLVAEARVLSAVLEPVQDILDAINIERAQLGALVNRMDFTMRSLDISSENLSDSESRIRNADMAREMMRFTSAQVLQQAGVSMLSHANNMPNNLLQLLN